MFVLSRDVSAAKRVIATLLATAVVLWASGVTSIARADNVQDASDLMTDTAFDADSNHTVTFTLVNDLTANQQVSVDFPDSFDFTGVTSGDVGIGGGTFGAATVSTATSSITFQNTGGTIASGTLITISATGTNKINNPSLTDDTNSNSNGIYGNESFEISISAGTDRGYTRVVILNTVLVTADVDSRFNFTVNGLGSGVSVNGTTTNAISSSTTIPFGTLLAYQSKTLAQNLQVESNAINGFVVTVQSDGDLRSSTGADIDNFKDNTLVTDPEAWESPLTGLDIDLENTWGHWGVTSEDATTTRAFEFGVNEWAGVSTTPTIVFSHDGPADAVTDGIGSTTVGYQVEISPLQEAADDYSTTLTYIATPTF